MPPPPAQRASASSDLTHNFKQVAAALALVGMGYSACWYQTKEIVLPNQQGRLGYEIEESRTKIGVLTQTLSKTTSEYAEKIALAEQQIRTLEQELGLKKVQVRDAQLANMFQFGMPYPVGLAAVKIGDPREEIVRVFSNERIKKMEDDPDGYWSVELDHGVFSSATYYFVRRRDKFTVGQILFHVRRDVELNDGTLEKKLTELLGSPTKQTKRGHKYWDVQGKLRVYWMRDRTYNVNGQDYVPGSWRD